jgi:hypothetical protein
MQAACSLLINWPDSCLATAGFSNYGVNNVGHLFTPTSLGDSGWPCPDKNIQEQADEKVDEFL